MGKMVSIIIPTRDREQFLLAACYSIMNQSYNNWEVIIVAHHDYDPSSMISLLDQKNRFKVISAPDGCGVGGARNLGIQESRGAYIAYLDDDDLWGPEYLQSQVSRLEYSGADAVWCNYHLRTQSWDDTKGEYYQHFIAVPYNVEVFNRNALLTEPFMHISTVLHTKELSNIVKFPDIPVLDDWMFLLDASKIFRFQHTDMSLVTIQRRLDGTNRRNEPGNETIRSMYHIMKDTESEASDPQTKVYRSILMNQTIALYEKQSHKEEEQLTTLVSRGPGIAYGYLLGLLKLGLTNGPICKLGYDIAIMAEQQELAEDLLWLSKWYNPIHGEPSSDYSPKHFQRKNEKWIVLQ